MGSAKASHNSQITILYTLVSVRLINTVLSNIMSIHHMNTGGRLLYSIQS